MGFNIYFRTKKYVDPYQTYFIVEELYEQEAPNGDYWVEISHTKSTTPEEAKNKLLKVYTKETIVEEFSIKR